MFLVTSAMYVYLIMFSCDNTTRGLCHYTINQVMSSVMIHGKMTFWDLILLQIIYNRKLLKLRSSLIFWIHVRVPIPSCSGRYGNSLFMISSTPYSHFPIGEPASVSHYIRTCYGYLAHSRVGSTLWMCVLVCERDNVCSLEPYLTRAYGSTSNAQIFGAERSGVKFHRGLGQGS